MCRKAIQLAILNKGFTGIATEPTHDMLRNIFIPEMIIALEEWGIKYKLNKAISTFFLYIDGIETKISENDTKVERSFNCTLWN